MANRDEIDPIDGREDETTDSDTVNIARREALLRMGKFAGLTAPVVVTLLTSNASEAWAASSPGRSDWGKSRRDQRRQARQNFIRQIFAFLSR